VLCVECLGPATIQFVDAAGMPIGTLCADCDAFYSQMREQMNRLIQEGIDAFS